ncbi:MAG TPA: pyruvate kinase [Candidatus Saccharimonadales bacterium]|nr:pyruvate kinase [Candidatus Saccharimonadales bacterium]
MGELSPKQPVALHDYKRTKIIVTIGPATHSYETIHKLIAMGANGLRLNFSHGTHDEKLEEIVWIRKASKELHKPVAIIQDLQGPKIRLGDFDDIIQVHKGYGLRFGYKTDWTTTGIIPTQYDLSTKVQRGERLYLYDGKVRTRVTSVKDGVVYVEAENDGILIARKGINLPDTDFSGDVITEKDRVDLAFGSQQDIDYVGMSFVQSAHDIEHMRRLIKNLGSPRRLIAKVETKLAVDNIEAIVQSADAVMVARGDLAVETPAESVPMVQRQIIGLGLKYGRPTIVATQMLASMTEMPEPTRAEVSDVATAVLVGADCVMLSDETANGQYPLEAVEIMKRVILYTQSHAPVKAVFPGDEERTVSRQLAISRGIISLSESISAAAIVAETKSGATALTIAAERPEIPLLAVTDDARTAQQLAIVYGVKSYVRPVSRQAAEKLTDFLRETRVFKKGDIVVTASGKYPGVVGTTDTIKVRQLD